MEKEVLSWVELYQSKCKENNSLREELDLLKTILHSYLPIVDGKNNDNNKGR